MPDTVGLAMAVFWAVEACILIQVYDGSEVLAGSINRAMSKPCPDD
jgi:hypothetical protein